MQNRHLYIMSFNDSTPAKIYFNWNCDLIVLPDGSTYDLDMYGDLIGFTRAELIQCVGEDNLVYTDDSAWPDTDNVQSLNS